MKNLPILVTVSGGRTSAFMAVYLNELYKDRDLLFVFANTGKENEKTLEFLNILDKYFKLNLFWIEAVVNPEKGKGTTFKVVDFKTASRNGEPFKEAIKKYGLPSKLYRHCTRELKEVPIHKFAQYYFKARHYSFAAAESYQYLETQVDWETWILSKNQNPKLHKKIEYLTAIGIRSDEKHRLGSKKNHIYPLAEINADKKFINDWWSRQPFNLELKEHQGNCDFCFLKSKNKRIKLLQEGLDVSWWDEMEVNYSRDKQPIFDVRNNLSIIDLINLSTIKNPQTSLVDDIGFDCFCKAN